MQDSSYLLHVASALLFKNMAENWYYLMAKPSRKSHAIKFTLFLWHMIPLELWPNTAQGCNHQSNCMLQLQSLCSAVLVLTVQPLGVTVLVSPVQRSKSYSISTHTQDSTSGGRIQNHRRWPLHCHCTIIDGLLLRNIFQHNFCVEP